MQAGRTWLHPRDAGTIGKEVPVGHEIARLGTAEDDDRQVDGILDSRNERAELVDGVRIDQVDRAIIEGHPPVSRGNLIHVELLRGLGRGARIHGLAH